MYHKIKDKTIKWTLENQKWLEEYIYILYIYIYRWLKLIM